MLQQPDVVDVHVGRVMRARRAEIKQSQSELGEALGVSFQQVQKYERAANRISASMLFRAAKAQGVPPAYYFEGLDRTAEEPMSQESSDIKAWLTTRQAWALAESCARLSNTANAALVQFARQMLPSKS